MGLDGVDGVVVSIVFNKYSDGGEGIGDDVDEVDPIGDNDSSEAELISLFDGVDCLLVFKFIFVLNLVSFILI